MEAVYVLFFQQKRYLCNIENFIFVCLDTIIILISFLLIKSVTSISPLHIYFFLALGAATCISGCLFRALVICTSYHPPPPGNIPLHFISYHNIGVFVNYKNLSCIPVYCRLYVWLDTTYIYKGKTLAIKHQLNLHYTLYICSPVAKVNTAKVLYELLLTLKNYVPFDCC